MIGDKKRKYKKCTHVQLLIKKKVLKDVDVKELMYVTIYINLFYACTSVKAFILNAVTGSLDSDPP